MEEIVNDCSVQAGTLQGGGGRGHFAGMFYGFYALFWSDNAFDSVVSSVGLNLK